MTTQIIIVIIFTFIINLIQTLSYSIRMVGIRTGKIAISFALFNVFALASRTAGTLQAPLLTDTIEDAINFGTDTNLMLGFRLILLSTTIASIVGLFLIPTFQRLFSKAVISFDTYRSIPKLVLHSFSKAGIKHFKESIKIPSKNNIKHVRSFNKISYKILIFNMITVSLLTIGSLAPLYAGILNPESRLTASSLNAVITGLATLLLTIFIDPHLSIMTDDVIEGKKTESEFRVNIIFVVISRIIGTLIAQVFFLPGAKVISYIANIL